MANNDDSVPPVPLPPEGAGVPPIEPTPATTPPAADANPDAAATPPPAPPAAVPAGYSAAPVPPAGQEPPAGYSAPPPTYTQPNPYAAPGAVPSYSTGQPQLPKGLSITSMVTGIAGVVLSFFGLGFLPALAGVITGHIAAKREPHGKPFWLTGLITGYVGVAIGLVTGLFILIAVLAAFSFAESGF